MTSRKRWTVPDQIQQKHVCQQVGEASEESFILVIMREGARNTQLSEEIIDEGESNGCIKTVAKDFRNSKLGQKDISLKCTCSNAHCLRNKQE